ncbi:phage holin family protein [Microbacterium marinilacus]|uniref:Phage holin family protein n=1 Tax=Microbacterium marinilacus TaxID=415209 RepID=A0ABP7BX58_9MICO|nr:phage holin family protein [Microbacterium marinilacus]MBY0688199.1 phage holin family protein [Microbacterium marinilacus]
MTEPHHGPSPVRDRADDGLFRLIGDVPQLVKNLVVAEFNAVKGWLVKTAKDAGIGTGLMFVALFFIAWVIPVFLTFLIALLSLWLPVWASALIVMGVGVVLAIAAGFAGLVFYRRIGKREGPIQAAHTDGKIVKDVADEF